MAAMSMSALLLAVRDTLRAAAPLGLSLRPVDCDVSPDGRPTPSSGERYVAIVAGSVSGTEIEGFQETFAFQIVVSYRGNKTPLDRWGSDLLCKPKTGVGLLDFCASIRVLLHLDVNADQLINSANTYINAAGQTWNGFVEPPRFLSADQPVVRGGSWWSADAKESLGGMSQTMSFGSAARFQRIEAMT